MSVGIMDDIKVSIIIPAYNAANFLREAIDCAIAQTYKNIEIIVINDGSDDNGATESIALEYGDKIRYYKKENGGVSSALNLGISEMTGEWFSWLSHDDLYTPDKIEKQINCVKQNKHLDKFVVINELMLINQDGTEIFRPKLKRNNRIYSPEQAFLELATKNEIDGCSVLIPKKAFEEIGNFSTEYRYVQDMDFWIRLMFAGYSYVFISDVLTKTRIHPGQVTARFPELFFVENEKMGMGIVQHFAKDVRGNLNAIIGYMAACIEQKNYIVLKEIVRLLKQHKLYSLNVRIIKLKVTVVSKTKNILRWIYHKIRN